MPIIYFFVLLEIAAVVGVSEPTIKLAFKPLYENRHDFPCQEFLQGQDIDQLPCI
jgi:hypothetical protein